MYCVNCGVKLADTQEKCPLCSTLPGTVPAGKASVKPLYPEDHHPEYEVNTGAVCGTVLFLFLIPVVVSFFMDMHMDRRIDWFWYVAGAMLLAYVVIALPLWFRKPNPVIFVPCDFGAVALYLLLIDLLTEGGWFLPFALPVTARVGLVVTAVITLLRYLRGGRLFIFGGALIAMGAVALLVEVQMCIAFPMDFAGWSGYPMIVLAMLGGLLIFLGVNRAARERMQRKFFL